jgi:hypothetical protein
VSAAVRVGTSVARPPGRPGEQFRAQVWKAIVMQRSEVMSIEARLAAVEARLEIGQLPIRYALAVDARDVEGWVNLFVPNVDCGSRGAGRDVLRPIVADQLTRFYRSVHQIVGHRIELTGPDSAVGQTYCRAEHEAGGKWIVMAICYQDTYRRDDATWYFERRREQHWYAADQLQRPQDVSFAGWDLAGPPAMPQCLSTWNAFWAGTDAAGVTSFLAH